MEKNANIETYDCAVIGGGVGGLTLSIQLASAGKKVILFEKEKYPFHRVCGEYISMESYNFLSRIGVQLSEMDLPVIDELRVSSPNGNYIERRLQPGGIGISRYTLDVLLAELAIKRGVKVVQQAKVNNVIFEKDYFEIQSRNLKIYAAMACGSYGKRSILDKKIGRTTAGKKNFLAVKYHIKTDLPLNRIELHNFKNGYCGISKVDGAKYCMCYLTDSSNLVLNNNNIKTLEENVLCKNPFLKNYFSHSQFLFDKPLTISQVTFKKKSPVQNNMIMLGDAAGTIAPLCGNGMSMAMRAAFFSSSLINAFLEHKITRQQMLTQYACLWNNNFSGRIKAGERLQYLFGRNFLTNTSINVLKSFPRITDKLIGLTHGKSF